MLNKTDLMVFSPTGGTLKVSSAFCKYISEDVRVIDLSSHDVLSGKKSEDIIRKDAEAVVIAAPVFAGRIPQFVCDKISLTVGENKKAIVIAVYGNRAYEDALLELADTAEQAGFKVIAAGAFVAQHSLAPNVAQNRPDEEDIKEIQLFAQSVLKKIENADESKPNIPGNRPYKMRKNMSDAPYTSNDCITCRRCVRVCPVEAVTFYNGRIETDKDKCILCVSCVANCPKKARVIPQSTLEHTKTILEKFKDLRNKNEVFI